MKRFLALALVVAMMLSLTPATYAHNKQQIGESNTLTADELFDVTRPGKPESADNPLAEVKQIYNKDDIVLYGDTPVFYGGDIEIKKGCAFMCGVTIGEIKKNYVLPHHQFFSAFGSAFRRKIDLAPDSDDIIKYLRGEEIKTDLDNGWAVVCVGGAALGGVKVSNKTAKNHYPKGLRTVR